MLVTGLAAAWIGFPIFFTDSPAFEVSAVGIGIFVLAPLSFAVEGIASWATGGGSSTPGYVIALGLVAIAAYPFHAMVNRRWGAQLTIVGLVAWILCQVFMVLAFRSI